jgi:hypothetical protein
MTGEPLLYGLGMFLEAVMSAFAVYCFWRLCEDAGELLAGVRRIMDALGELLAVQRERLKITQKRTRPRGHAHRSEKGPDSGAT